MHPVGFTSPVLNSLKALEDHAHQLLPQAEQEVQGGQQDDEHVDEGSGEHGELFGVVLGDGLGGDLAEDQDHHGDDGGGNSGTTVAQQVNEEQGADGGQGDVDHVVADEDGGDQLVVILRQPQGQLGLVVTLLGHGLQTGAVDGGESGLRGGEVSGQDHADHHGHDV